MSSWSSGIVVASTSIPATVVDAGCRASPAGAAIADIANSNANRITRPRERRTGLVIAQDLHQTRVSAVGAWGTRQWNARCQVAAKTPGWAWCPVRRRISRSVAGRLEVVVEDPVCDVGADGD